MLYVRRYSTWNDPTSQHRLPQWIPRDMAHAVPFHFSKLWRGFSAIAEPHSLPMEQYRGREQAEHVAEQISKSRRVFELTSTKLSTSLKHNTHLAPRSAAPQNTSHEAQNISPAPSCAALPFYAAASPLPEPTAVSPRSAAHTTIPPPIILKLFTSPPPFFFIFSFFNRSSSFGRCLFFLQLEHVLARSSTAVRVFPTQHTTAVVYVYIEGALHA